MYVARPVPQIKRDNTTNWRDSKAGSSGSAVISGVSLGNKNTARLEDDEAEEEEEEEEAEEEEAEEEEAEEEDEWPSSLVGCKMPIISVL